MDRTSVGQMAEWMGSMTSDAEAQAMIEILGERGLDPDEMSDSDFAALIPDAIERSRRS
jgi:hypothetical protein